MMQSVVNRHQSPMNAQQWLLNLMCGHSVWVTSRSRPKRLKADCEKCDKSSQQFQEESQRLAKVGKTGVKP